MVIREQELACLSKHAAPTMDSEDPMRRKFRIDSDDLSVCAWNSVQKDVNLADLVKRFPTSI